MLKYFIDSEERKFSGKRRILKALSNFIISDVSSNCFHDCVAFWNPAILYAEKVEICPYESLNLLSEKLKQDESLWYKFVNLDRNKRIEDFLYN